MEERGSRVGEVRVLQARRVRKQNRHHSITEPMPVVPEKSADAIRAAFTYLSAPRRRLMMATSADMNERR